MLFTCKLGEIGRRAPEAALELGQKAADQAGRSWGQFPKNFVGCVVYRVQAQDPIVGMNGSKLGSLTCCSWSPIGRLGRNRPPSVAPSASCSARRKWCPNWECCNGSRKRSISPDKCTLKPLNSGWPTMKSPKKLRFSLIHRAASTRNNGAYASVKSPVDIPNDGHENHNWQLGPQPVQLAEIVAVCKLVMRHRFWDGNSALFGGLKPLRTRSIGRGRF